MASSGALHVAVGVVRDSDGNILITQRARHAHQGGLWEFPGGKLEHGEEVLAALRRELREEVGILIDGASPLIKIHHHYPDLEVLLDVWRVDHFSGQACACEGQAMRWVASEDLNRYEFPVANRPIIAAAQLPDRYAILEGRSVDQVLANLSKIIGNGVRLLQLRVKSLPASEILTVYAAVFAECQRHGVKLLLNSDLPLFQAEADGIHLSSHALMMANQRPENYAWVAASCHDLKELEHAQSIGVDFAVLAPILPTPTHPDATPLGWDVMAELIEQVNLPVFALGGLKIEDIQRVLQAGGQGIAGISAFL
jgi:mutator mutT protein